MIYRDKAKVIEFEGELLDLYKNKEYKASIVGKYLIEFGDRFIVLTNRETFHEFDKKTWLYTIKEK